MIHLARGTGRFIARYSDASSGHAKATRSTIGFMGNYLNRYESCVDGESYSFSGADPDLVLEEFLGGWEQ